jgi:hypothetical protein
MSIEKKDSCSLKVSSEDLSIDPKTLYKKVLRICRLEADSNVYDEDTVGHFMNINSKLEASLEGEDRDFLIEGFSFLRESEDVVVAVLLRDLTGADYSGTREFLSPGEAGNFEYFENRIMQGERPKKMMSMKIEMIYGSQENNFYTHDYFFSLYPVYLQLSDPDRIQEIEDIVSRIEDREVVPV